MRKALTSIVTVLVTMVLALSLGSPAVAKSEKEFCKKDAHSTWMPNANDGFGRCIAAPADNHKDAQAKWYARVYVMGGVNRASNAEMIGAIWAGYRDNGNVQGMISWAWGNSNQACVRNELRLAANQLRYKNHALKNAATFASYADSANPSAAVNSGKAVVDTVVKRMWKKAGKSKANAYKKWAQNAGRSAIANSVANTTMLRLDDCN